VPDPSISEYLDVSIYNTATYPGTTDSRGGGDIYTIMYEIEIFATFSLDMKSLLGNRVGGCGMEYGWKYT